MNLLIDDVRYNSKKLLDFDNLPQPARDFINDIRSDSILRWGGDFKDKNGKPIYDVVHIDDGLNVYNTQEYLRVLNFFQILPILPFCQSDASVMQEICGCYNSLNENEAADNSEKAATTCRQRFESIECQGK